MTNIFQSPNLLRINGDFSFAYSFGEMLNVHPHSLPGDHRDHVVASFRGLHIELTAQDARRLAAGLLLAAERVRDTPDYSGITAHLEDA